MKINGSSWKFALLFLTGIIIAGQLMFIIHWRWKYWQNKHWKEDLPSNWIAIEVPVNQTYTITRRLKGPTVAIVNGTSAIAPKPNMIVQELICPRDQRTQHGCYVIVDGPALSGTGISRFLVMEPQNQSTFAEVELKFPLHQNFTCENARQWPVLSTKIPHMDYQKAMVAQPFITQTFGPSLTPDKVTKRRRILCLGLHGSNINNFFANLSTKYDVTVIEPEPALRYIAEKWFGYEETEHHRIFVENPLFYVTARARLFENSNNTDVAVIVPSRFDYILLDVCHGLGSSTAGLCPIKELEEETTVAALDRNLANNGTISLHFATAQQADSANNTTARHQLANREHQILQLYKKYFKNCYFLGVGAVDLVLTCTRRAPLTRANYIMGLRKLPRDWQQFQPNQEPKFFLDIEAL